MAEKEIWVYLLAYNLIRLLMAQVSVITIIDVVMFTLFDGVSGNAKQKCSDWPPCRCWC